MYLVLNDEKKRCKLKESSMKAERYNVLSVCPVNYSEVCGIQEEEIALLPDTIKAYGHKNTIIFSNTIRSWHKYSLSTVMVFHIEHLLPPLPTHIPLDQGVVVIVYRDPAIHPAILLTTIPFIYGWEFKLAELGKVFN